MITITLALEHPLSLEGIQCLGFLNATTLTIASGAITVTQVYHKIDTQSGAASDDLTIINGGRKGLLLYLCAADDTHTVVLKHDDTAGAGKIVTPDSSDYSLDDDNKVTNLLYDDEDDHWHVVGPAGTSILNSLTDVTITSVADNEVLAYDSGSSIWINQTAVEASLVAAISSTDHAIARFNSTAGQVQDSSVLIDDSDNITGVAALTLGDVLTFSDGATIDNSDATTLQLTETNIDLVGACAADALTLSDVLTFSDGATIDNTDASTLTITETNVVIAGNLDVTGTTTTINSTTLQVDDKNIELGTVASPTDTTADGGGITLKGGTDKTIVWDNANDNWTFNQAVNIASGLDFKVNNVSVLNATTLGGAVVSSSLTSVGTLTSLGVSGATTFYGGSTIIGYDVGAAMTIAASDTTGVTAITHAGSGVTVTWTAPSFDFVGAIALDATTLSDVLTFSDGATIDNSDATTLQLTETTIDLVGATLADALTLSDVLTFSDGGTIDNADATTLTLTETTIDLVGATLADALTLSDVLTFSDGGTIDNSDATTLALTEITIDLVGATLADTLALSDVLTFSDGGTIDNTDATTLTLTEATIAVAGILTVSGASTLSSTLTVGVDDTGHDVKFFGATSGAYFLFDESADAVVLQGGATKQMELRFMEDTDNGTNYIALKAPATLAANVTLVLPPTDGDVNQYLKTDGAGVLTWATPAGAGDVSKVGTPVDNEIGVWTGDGSIEGDTDFQWDGSAFKMLGTILIKEQADAAADVAGYGQIWVNTATPNELWFTNDAGTDAQLGVGEVTKSGTPANDQIAVWTGDGPIEGTADLTFASNQLVVKKDAIVVTQGAYGLLVQNTTAALTGERVQYSPPIRWRGYGWETDVGSSMSVDFRAFVRPITGAAAPTGGLDFQASINGGAYSDLVTILSTGFTGFGTPEPTGKIHIVGSGTVWIKVIGDDTGDIGLLLANGGGTHYFFDADGDAHNFKVQSANAVTFQTGGNNDRLTILSTGQIGVATTNPGQIFDVNDGSGNMIADGYDSHPSVHALKENAVALTGAGMIDKLKSFKLFEFTRRPYVSADELRTATIKHFSPKRWVEAFGGQVVEDESGVERVEGDDYRGGKLYMCPDEGMLAFLDSTAEKLRVERRKLPEWQRKHFGFIIDDPGTEEALGDVIHYDETGKTTGYSLNNYVGFLHGVILELVNRVETLETA